jgi:hypothetical protein
MLEEIADTIERLRARFEAIAIRGIRATGSDDLALLKAAGEEFERIGAAHMAERIGDVVRSIEDGGHGASAALLRAQTSLRLFERVLTLEIAEGVLSSLALAGEMEQDADH